MTFIALAVSFLYLHSRIDLLGTRYRNAQERIDRLTTDVYNLTLELDGQRSTNANLYGRVENLENRY